MLLVLIIVCFYTSLGNFRDTYKKIIKQILNFDKLQIDNYK